MPIHISCECGRLLVVPETRRGRDIHCPRCARKLHVPSDAPVKASSTTQPGVKPKTEEQPSTKPTAVEQQNRDVDLSNETAGDAKDSVDVPLPPPPPSDSSDRLPIIVDATDNVRSLPRPDRDQRTVHLLAMAMVFVALFNAIPILISVLGPEDVETERWVYGVLLISILQLVYALYLAQLPDWSSVWVVSILSLTITTLYAGLMGLRLLASNGNAIMQFFELDGNRFSTGEEAGWCFVMVLLTGTFSYFSGRFASQWYRRHGLRAAES